MQLKSQPGESSGVVSRVSDLVGILLAASEFVGQHVSSLLKVIMEQKTFHVFNCHCKVGGLLGLNG